MAAETPARYARHDDELLDAGRIVHTRKDTRAVGEMLHDADHLARHLLMDISGEDAGPMLRSWPALVDAASLLWDTLPRRRLDPTEHQLAMQRLVATTGTFTGLVARPGSWPGDGPSHTGVDQITETLRTAGALIARYGTDLPAHQSRTAHDIDAGRARVMHTLYVTAHAVTVALNTHGKDLVRVSRVQGRPIPLSNNHTAYAVPPTGRWMHRAARCENLARDYLAGRFVNAARGEAQRPAEDEDRIPCAVARWDIQAHRALARNPSPANLVLIIRTQALMTSVSVTLSNAVARSRLHVVDEAHTDERARLAMSRAAASWSQVGSRWLDLTRPSDRLDPALAASAAEVRAAYRELTHNVTTQASPDVIATRPGLARGFTAGLDALEAAGEIAHGLTDQAERSDLVGPARALSRRAQDDIEVGPDTADLDDDCVWVSPADILARRLVPLPKPVADGLLRASFAVTQDTATAAAAARAAYQNRTTEAAMPVSTPSNPCVEAPGLERPEATLGRAY
ncbi:MAG: hypothetical protein JWR90_103 [Marmoricola sp.]|nr:hypothetical protein [Marmoricola sp.]